ncbi:MAG: hypothetical protein P8Y44_07220, partial [Acidobacteriota bacterium]
MSASRLICIWLGIALLVAGAVAAQEVEDRSALGLVAPDCHLTDEAGFQWFVFTELDSSADGYMSDGYAGGDAGTTGYLDAAGNLRLTAINPAMDGCSTQSDYFTYVGTCGNFVDCSGSWESYCAGTPLNRGDWTASFSSPCPPAVPRAESGPAFAGVAGDASASASEGVPLTQCALTDDAGFSWTLDVEDIGLVSGSVTGAFPPDPAPATGFYNYENLSLTAVNQASDGCNAVFDSFAVTATCSNGT